jgi:DNA-binding winged helix-turn-helix (wHTH) protein/tetratricopeptide (TPR) repeat protein
MSVYRFGEYRLDVHRRLLIAGEREIPLSAKIFGVLLHLVRAVGETVTKDELIAGIWQDENTSEATVVEHIWLVRKLFGDRAKSHKYILTIPGKGYQFVPRVWHDAGTDVATSAEPAVWREYLLASHCAGPRTAAGDAAALKHYNAAIALDPSFVLAHIGVADCYTNMAFQGFVKLECVLGPALAAINRAIALDPRSAPAHIALAQIQLAQWDILGCERALELAANLDPLSAEVHELRAFIQVWRGEPESAVADAKCALAISPTDLNVHGTLANAFAWEGDYANAIASYSKIIEIDPTRKIARQGRCQVYVATGELDLALRDLEQLPPTPANLSRRACVHAFMGDELSAKRLLSDLQRRASNEHVQPYCLAQVHIALGHTEAVLCLAAAAIELNDLRFPALLDSPLFARRINDRHLREGMSDFRRHLCGGRRKIGGHI